MPTERLRLVAAAAVAAAVALIALRPGHAQPAARAAVDKGVVDIVTNLAFGNGAAAGTGIVLTSSGEVLTNNHVIRGATTIRVIVPSTGRRYAATVLGYSVKSDVAVLRLKNPSRLATVSIGDSSSVKVGHRVVAVGNAGGVGGTPTSTPGKVTGLNRSIRVSDDRGSSAQLSGLIRIDAALEPGDSGGPLLSSAGRVIGIDTAASVGYGFEGQPAHESYAIPINRAMAIARQVERRRGSATVHIGSTPFLGVTVAPADNGLTGALVVAVASGSPADRAGIAAGDTITTLDSRAIASYDALASALLGRNAGATVMLGWVDSGGTSHAARVKTIAGPPQ